MPDEAALQRLLDRQEIEDCLLRYTRALDRGDWEQMALAYHEDALDDHGYFVGRGQDLVKWSAAFRKDNPDISVVRHVLSNHSIEFDGTETAHVETYYTNETVLFGEKPVMRISLGRYIDRFERRAGEWRIAARVCTVEATGQCDYVPLDEKSGFASGRRDKSDISYERPLNVKRPLTDKFIGPNF